MQLHVHYLPQFVSETELAGGVVVMVDLLRASTTICHALAAGADSVIPCVEVDETFRRAQGSLRSEVLMGGERSGMLIEGFDLGNSPAEYTPERVFGRTILFTTTNGTKALAHSHLAAEVLVGAAVNRHAVVERIAAAEHVHLLCAGTGGKVTREDLLAAGAIYSKLRQRTPVEQIESNEWAEAVLGEWQELVATARSADRSVEEQFALELRDTQGGKNLLALGYDDDLPRAAALDTLDVLPQMDHTTGRITLR